MNIKRILSFYTRSKIIYKMIIGSLIFTIPIGVLLYFTIGGFNYHIDFAKKELQGIELMSPIKTLLHEIPLYTYLVEQNPSDKKNKDEVSEKIVKLKISIEKQFENLIIKAKINADLLGIRVKNEDGKKFKRINPIRILDLWKKSQIQLETPIKEKPDKKEQDLELDLENLSLESIQKNETKVVDDDEEEINQIQIEEDNTINNLILLLSQIGNKSKLLHDPDTNSYHSMDTALLIMPKFHLRMHEFKSKCIESLKSSNSRELRQKINQLNFNFGDDLGNININNPKVYNQYDKSISEIIPYLELIINRKWVDKKKFYKDMDSSIASSYKLWGEVILDLKSNILIRKKSYERKKFFAVFISLITFILALGMAILISFGISVPLKNIIIISEDIANGKIGPAREKLDKILKQSEGYDTSKNELHKLLLSINVMTDNIDSLLTQVTKSSAQVTTSASQIAGSARQLEATVAEQASSTNQVAAMSKEISKTSNTLSKTMENVTNMAVEASDDAQAGNEKVLNIKNTMQTLLSSSDEISDKLAIIRKKTDNINKVIITVTKVANQTNLLSLNAAIEAEKAGEYGIGFAVVAREIRRLADQTAVATLDIEDMISEMKTAVNDGATSIEKFSVQVKNDSDNVNGISENLLGIIDKTSDLRPEFEDVYKGMQLQVENSDQINNTMDQLNEVAAHTRDSAIEFKKATDILNGAITELQDEVTRFLVGN